MILTYDEQVLVTTGIDGSLCFWDVIYPDGKSLILSKDFLHLNQILISRDDLSEKVLAIGELNTRIKELESEHDYVLRQTNHQYEEKIATIHQSYQAALSQLYEHTKELEQDHVREINDINVEITKLKQDHEQKMINMKNDYCMKLDYEYNRYDEFEKQTNVMQEDYECRLAELSSKSKSKLEETIAKYEDRLKEKDLLLKEAHDEMVQEMHMQEVIKTQIEEDTDREIVELRTNHERILHEERQIVLKLKGEAGVLRNKHAPGQKDIEELRKQLNSTKNEFTQLKTRKEELDKDITNLKCELQDKESVILDKENSLVELEQANQELTKFKFVLNHRIDELENQIAPRDNEIAVLKSKIANMESELIGMDKMNESLKLRLNEVLEKLNATKREAHKEEQRRKRNQKLLRRIRIELLDTSMFVQEPNALKSAIIKLYQRYSDNEEFLRNYKADLEAQCEFARQRDHLEKTIGLLKKQVSQNSLTVEPQMDRILEENVALLTELDAFREQLKTAQSHITDMESLLGLRGRHDVEAGLARTTFHIEELELSYRTQIQECQRMIGVLKDDVDRLLDKLVNKYAR